MLVQQRFKLDDEDIILLFRNAAIWELDDTILAQMALECSDCDVDKIIGGYAGIDDGCVTMAIQVHMFGHHFYVTGKAVEKVRHQLKENLCKLSANAKALNVN